MSAFGCKADIDATLPQCLLLTHNGHPPSIHVAVAKRVLPLSVSVQNKRFEDATTDFFAGIGGAAATQFGR
jgi:hypothetical protein